MCLSYNSQLCFGPQAWQEKTKITERVKRRTKTLKRRKRKWTKTLKPQNQRKRRRKRRRKSPQRKRKLQSRDQAYQCKLIVRISDRELLEEDLLQNLDGFVQTVRSDKWKFEKKKQGVIISRQIDAVWYF